VAEDLELGSQKPATGPRNPRGVRDYHGQARKGVVLFGEYLSRYYDIHVQEPDGVKTIDG
jgi:hypothetical protein